MLTSARSCVAARTFELDLRHLPHSHRHSVVFARLDALGPDTRLIVDDEVSIDGPYGTFVDHLACTAPCLFLAAGSGLAPMRALLEAALAAGTRRSLTLIFSARTEADVIDGQRFIGWQQRHAHFRFIRTLTRAAGAPPTGRIPTFLPRLGCELVEHDVFIAGAPAFVVVCAATAEQ